MWRNTKFIRPTIHHQQTINQEKQLTNQRQSMEPRRSNRIRKPPERYGIEEVLSRQDLKRVVMYR